MVLSQFLEDGYAVDLLGDRPEGVGYLLEDRVSDVGSFAQAVRRVARGGSVTIAECSPWLQYLRSSARLKPAHRRALTPPR